MVNGTVVVFHVGTKEGLITADSSLRMSFGQLMDTHKMTLSKKSPKNLKEANGRPQYHEGSIHCYILITFSI